MAASDLGAAPERRQRQPLAILLASAFVALTVFVPVIVQMAGPRLAPTTFTVARQLLPERLRTIESASILQALKPLASADVSSVTARAGATEPGGAPALPIPTGLLTARAVDDTSCPAATSTERPEFGFTATVPCLTETIVAAPS